MRVRLKDVAERAGVATNTASTILNKKPNSWASKETEERVFKAAKELGYKPNRLAVALSSGSYKTMGLIIPDLHNPYFTSLAEGLETALRGKGYDLIIETTHSSIRRESQALESICERQIEGFACALINNEEHERVLRETFNSGKSVVGLKEALGPHNLPIHTVETDFSMGLSGAIDFLLTKKHDNFIFLLAKTAKQEEGGRPSIFKQCLINSGIPETGIAFANCDHTLQGSRNEFQKMIRTKQLDSRSRVAVIAHNDLSAIGVIRATIDAGLRCPDNVAVVGIDNTQIGEHLPISLSTIAQPMDYVIQNIVSLLLNAPVPAKSRKCDGAAQSLQRIVLPSWFIPRESTGK